MLPCQQLAPGSSDRDEQIPCEIRDDSTALLTHACSNTHTYTHVCTYVIVELILMQQPGATGLQWWKQRTFWLGSTEWALDGERVWQCRTWKTQGLFKQKHEISLLLKRTVCLKMGLSQTQAVWKRLMQEWSRKWESSEKRWWETKNDP